MSYKNRTRRRKNPTGEDSDKCGRTITMWDNLNGYWIVGECNGLGSFNTKKTVCIWCDDFLRCIET